MNDRPRVAVFKFASCDGCQLSILNLEDEILALADRFQFAFFLEASSRTQPGPYDVVLVEGAGGVLVPILDGLDMLGLAAALELPLVLVARAALGTINHTLLSLEAARARGVPVVGVAISHTAPDLSAADRSNLDRLLEELPVPCLGELAHGSTTLEPQLSAEALLALLAEPSPKRR